MYKPLTQVWSEGEESEEDLKAKNNNGISPAKPVIVSSSKIDIPTGTYSTTGGVESLYATNGAHLGNLPLKAKEEARPLTLKRKIALILSILNCIAFTIVFMWLLPCDKDTCRAKPVSYEWKRSFPNLSFTSLSHSSHDQNGTVVIASYQVESVCEAMNCQGLLALGSKNGAELWRINIPKPVRKVDCESMTTGDCLVSLKTGGLLAYQSKSGDLLWQMHHHNEEDSPGITSELDISYVVALHDLSADNVTDLAVFSANSITFVSGGSGKILGNRINFTDCSDLTLPIANKAHLEFYCIQGPKNVLKKVPFTELYKTALNTTVQWTGNSTSFTTNMTYPSQLVYENYSVAIVNEGSCPQCKATLIVRNANKTIVEETWKQTHLHPFRSYRIAVSNWGLVVPMQVWYCTDVPAIKWLNREKIFLAVIEDGHAESNEIEYQFTYPLVDVTVGLVGPQLFYGEVATLNSHLLKHDIKRLMKSVAN